MEGRTEEGRTDSVFHDESQWKDSGAHSSSCAVFNRWSLTRGVHGGVSYPWPSQGRSLLDQ